jgi:prepilin-type N-terminal cleavage/methylation domain-containing protein
MKRSSLSNGFTLLEVLIAVALLGASLMVVVQSQAVNALQTKLARDLSVSAMLAREKMGEIEIEIRKKQNFDDLDEDCGHGDFEEQGYPAIEWSCKNEPLKLDMDSSQLLSALEAIANGEENGELLSLAADFGGLDLNGLSNSPQGQLMLQVFPLIAEVLGQAIRRITLNISWANRDETISFPVVLFITDPTRVTNPLQIPGTTGGTAPPVPNSGRP